MNDPFSLTGCKITDVTALENSDGFVAIRLVLDDGMAVKFSSTDAKQDSTSCGWHEHPIDCHITVDE